MLQVQESRDAYHVLQIEPSAVPEVVEAAYRALALLHHPDLTQEAGSADAIAELNWAYATLKSAESRAAYDRARVALSIAAPTGTLSQRMREGVVATAERAAESPSRVTLDFGRYAGMTLGQIARIDVAYLEWLKRHSSGIRYRHQIEELLSSMPARRTESG